MGKAQSIPVQYGNFVGEQQPGESRELVSARLETMNTKSPERSTMLDAFLYPPRAVT